MLLPRLLTVPLLAMGIAVHAAEPAEQPQRCLRLSEIKSTEVLDKQQILFEATGGRYFVNVLPYKCPGLRRDAAILHRTSLDRMCDLDVITVLESTGGGFFPGASCGLGRFNPIDKEEAEALRKRSN